MAAVLKLVLNDNSETVAIFEHMTELARQGKVKGSAVCFRDENGKEHAIFTGVYRTHPDKAAGAALRMSMMVAQLRGEYDSSP